MCNRECRIAMGKLENGRMAQGVELAVESFQSMDDGHAGASCNEVGAMEAGKQCCTVHKLNDQGRDERPEFIDRNHLVRDWSVTPSRHRQ
jgi:hypothetical protein